MSVTSDVSGALSKHKSYAAKKSRLNTFETNCRKDQFTKISIHAQFLSQGLLINSEITENLPDMERKTNKLMPWSHLCVKPPRMSHV